MYVLSLLAIIVGFAAATDICYVRPANSLSDCLHLGQQPCLTLGQYAREDNITTGTSLHFLPGNHTLQEFSLNLTNVSNVTLRAVETNLMVNIICTNAVTILCENVTGLVIEGLTFLMNHTNFDKTVLKLTDCRDALLSSVVFQTSGRTNDSKATAMLLEHSTATIKKSMLKDNVGGALHIRGGSNISISESAFIENKGLRAGGAVYVTHSMLLLDGTNFTHNSDVHNGGAIQCYKCTLLTKNTNIFQSNHVPFDSHVLDPATGGALYAYQGKFYFSGPVHFFYNSATTGGAIELVQSEVTFLSEALFQGNRARDFGCAISSKLSTVVGNLCITESNCTRGVIKIVGDGKRSRDATLSASLMNNRAAVEIFSAQVVFLNTTMADNSIDVALNLHDSNITFRGSTRIVGNTGGGIRAESSSLTFENDTLFEGNSSPTGGSLLILGGTVTFHGNTLFYNNRAGGDGGAVFVAGTSIHIHGTVNFTRNVASNGGALYLDAGAFLYVESVQSQQAKTLLYTSLNAASKYGGAVYHKDSPSSHQCNDNSTKYKVSVFLPLCFLQGNVTYESFEILSYDDVAETDGGFLYGGLLDRCRVKSSSHYFLGYYQLLDRWKVIINIYSQQSTRKEISSKPYSLCFCHNIDRYDCQKSLNIEVYRGQRFSVFLDAFDQVSATSTTISAITSSRAKLEIDQTSQSLPDHCSALSYTLYSSDSYSEVVLHHDGPCRDIGSARVVINATLLPCPDGFTQSDVLCICEKRLQHYSINCTIVDSPYFTKTANSNFWMGVLYTNLTYDGLVVAKSCPVEYCKRDTVNITLDDTDLQCDLNRSGLLCGACATNHSLMLGSSQCQICSNIYLTLLFPFAAAGIALVVFLSFLRLTVATGTLNSVIFYANFIQVNRKLFFPANTRNVLTVFIAWLNLDLGFETCFYDGMDAYAQTWLQFAFPLYVWLLISLMIVVSRYSITLSKLTGHNPIAVLATLLLMSYTKILKIIIEVYSSADLDYPDNDTVTVWLKDANVPYLQSKHLFLTVVTSLVLVFFFIPYTLLLLLGHKLYFFTGRKYWHWLNRLKPLLDSYHAPYKVHTRYWTGFLLLVRCALYIVFVLNSLSTSKICLAMVLTFTGLEVIMGLFYSGHVYKMKYNNILEALVYLNVITLSAVTLAGLSTPTLTYVLVTLVFLIVAFVTSRQFHLLYISKTALWQRLEGWWLRFRSKESPKPTTAAPNAPRIVQNPYKNVTSTVVELRELLLEN